MMKKMIRKGLWLVTTSLVCQVGLAALHTNVLFILADDYGWADVGCYGSTFYETPNLDRLAKEGMRFTDGYAASPICSPTRSSIMTGKSPARTNNTQYFGGPQPSERYKGNTLLWPARYHDVMDLEEVTIAEAMKAHGYATFFAGKWHLGHKGYWPEDQGFDINKGGWSAGGPYGGKKYFSPYENPRLEDGPEGEHLPDRLASETVAFMKANQQKPFLAYLSFYSVHSPFMAPEHLTQKYKAKNPPKTVQEVQGSAKKVRINQSHPVYAGMVEAMDRAVGKVLDGLQELGLDENTMVVFMSDNGGVSTAGGWPTSNHPLRTGKGWLYEGGIREPLIIKAPGITKPGSICAEPVISTDFYPTLLDVCGLPLLPEQHQDGVSLVPLLKGDETFARGEIYFHYPQYSGGLGGRPASAIRSGDWKLIRFYEDERVELYNLKDDLSETKDLAKVHPEKAEALRLRLNAWLKETGAKFPTPNPNYDPSKEK
jgi:arylsulfatase A-like enzyme